MAGSRSPVPDDPDLLRVLSAAEEQQGHLTEAEHAILDGLRTARNDVECPNHGGRYDDVLTFSGSSEGRSARRR